MRCIVQSHVEMNNASYEMPFSCSCAVLDPNAPPSNTVGHLAIYSRRIVEFG